MRRKYVMLDLRLFDGDAAGGAGGAASGAAGTAGNTGTAGNAGTAGGGAEAPGAEAGKGDGQGSGPAGEPGGDPDSGDGVEELDKPGQKTAEQLQKEFDAMVGGEYRQQFLGAVRGILSRSEQDVQQLRSQAEEVKPLLDMLGARYGVKSGKVADLMSAIDADSEFFEAAAMREGLSVEQYRRMLKMRAENTALKEAQQRAEQIRQRDDAWRRWDAQAEACRQQFPGFDMQKECRNPQFVELLGAGIDVGTAYKAVHHDELVNSAVAQARTDTKKQVADTIRSGAGRPRENQMGGQGASDRKVDVANMPDDQFEDLIRRAKRGETILL